MTRVREILGSVIAGSAQRSYPFNINIEASGRNSTDFCEDTPGEADGQYFYALHLHHDNGNIADGVIGNRTWSNFPLQGFRSTGYLDSHLPVNIPDNGALAARLLAMTSPNAPAIDLPVFIKELPEIVDIFRFFHRIFKGAEKGNIPIDSTTAEAVLLGNFGVAPLVQDIRKLLSFHDIVEKKLQELRSLQQSGLRRKRSLYVNTVQGSVPSFVASSELSYVIRYDGVGSTTADVSGFVKWFPSGNFKSFSDVDLRRAANIIALGGNIDAATIWQAMPWSWLADWFSSAGDLLEAYRHGIPCYHSPVQIMKHLKTEWKFDNHDMYTEILPRTHTRTRESKQREIASATLTAHMPFLSGRQVAILGSLAVLKGKNLSRLSAAARNG